MKRKKIPIGVEFFDRIIKNNSYYVDKTLLIKELLDSDSAVTVFMRPRRFGKTLALSMIQYFFENLKKEDAYIFEGLNITKVGDEYLKHQNAYPVINFTFKDVEGIASLKAKTAEEKHSSMVDSAKAMLRQQIMDEIVRHKYILDSEKVEAKDKKIYNRILEDMDTEKEFNGSIRLLTNVLRQYYGQKAILIIDEYDVPLEKAYFNGYYDEMVKIIRALFSQALKTNPHLQFAVITGCLRVSKESIFTGVNNLDMVSITSTKYDEYFGFTEEEAFEMLDYYDRSEKKEEMRRWYNGYLFGETTVYNPWSSVKYLSDMVSTDNPAFQLAISHWGNTSSNAIVKELIREAEGDVVEEIEALMAGGVIEKPMYEDIIYSEIKSNPNNLWNFLFFTGYLKAVSYRKHSDKKTILAKLKIPNSEISYIYTRQIREWFDEKNKDKEQFKVLYDALHAQDSQTMIDEITNFLLDTISYFDGTESFYHGFMAGILMGIPQSRIVSNRESGNGRPDIMILPRTIRRPAYVIEFKISKTGDDLEKDAEDALAQIHKNNYIQEAHNEGYREIITLGIAFFKKDCHVVF